MKRLLICLIFFLQVVASSHIMGQGFIKTEEFKIASPAFENQGHIPSKHTCDGANVNPPLKIENVPQGTQSLALIFDDLDAPRGSYVHWILWNIDPHVKEIKENAVPEGAVQGMNDFKRHPYGGPCPPKRAHRYIFKIYALDSPLKLNSNSTKTDLEKAMKGHILAQAQWTGVYQRVGASPK
ncbi:MAG: YbhB/YbcL family Raf kinase inhibitor-like protein [Syntrophaceae bacterium]|nr:YbhB/YbcL family Raf kinase inhibitor-like protein [Syntrophaceae bacterium]